MKPILGTTENGSQFKIDLPRLIETRMLIQANSGGGKSYAIRKLLEETHGHIQQIVLDMEGEFSTLREHFDYILAGKGGDIDASPKTADLLARKVLELGADLIVDLYELKQRERIHFVKIFVDALVNAPKELWHPVLIVIDEAHVFVPEKGESEAMSAVVDLATRGRKRGFCPVLATQRLSKLNKDVAAECLNKLIGRTGLDIDMRRAAEELGFASKADMLELRNLKPGSFFAFGPAISNQVTAVSIGEVKSTHPKAGQRLSHHVPVPTAKVRKILTKLTDLPKEAEQELRDKNQMMQRIRELERNLKAKPLDANPEALDKAFKKGFEQARREMNAELSKLTGLLSKLKPHALAMLKVLDQAPGKLDLAPEPRNIFPAAVTPRNISHQKLAYQPDGNEHTDESFGRCERKILGFLNLKPGEYFSTVQVGAMTGYRHSSGGFNNALSKLHKAGLIFRQSGSIALNPDVDVSGLVDEQQHTLEDWINKLGKCERAIYEIMLAQPDATFSKQDIAEATNYSPGSGGFNNALSRLATLGLMRRHSDGRIGINPEVLEISER